MDEAVLKSVIAKNITEYRKQYGWTQLELAEKLNYSDKAVSKWERAEGAPDVYVLAQLAKLFKVRIDDLTRDTPAQKIYIGISIEKKIIVPLMAIFGVFLLATVVFGLLIMLNAPVKRPWLCFIYAVPSAAVCGLVFSSVWRRLFLILLCSSILTWTLAVSLFLSLLDVPMSNDFVVFLIPLPIQGLLILPYIMAKISLRRKAKINTHS